MTVWLGLLCSLTGLVGLAVLVAEKRRVIVAVFLALCLWVVINVSFVILGWTAAAEGWFSR